MIPIEECCLPVSSPLVVKWKSTEGEELTGVVTDQYRNVTRVDCFDGVVRYVVDMDIPEALV